MAEREFLNGDVRIAVEHYSKAINILSNRNLNDSDANSYEELKLIEIVAVLLKKTGGCEIAIGHLETHLAPGSDKTLVAKVIREIIICNHLWNSTLDQDFQKEILDFFTLRRIDEGAYIQLADFLNGSYSDNEEFTNFFHLLEKGFVPALLSMDIELAAEKRATRLGWTILNAILIIAILGFILYTLLKKREHLTREKVALLEGKEKETYRLSVDLHDILGYKIVELKDQVRKLTSSPSDEVKLVANGLDELHESMRYIVQSNLTPQSLKFGLSPALDTLFNRVNDLGIIEFKLYKHRLEERIDIKKEKHIFYIIQELVNNVIKHSKGRKASFEVTKLKGEISIVTEDDGIGYKPSADTLKTIKARTSFLKGRVVEESKLDQGSTIIISIPVE